jgi:hypothetical protein
MVVNPMTGLRHMTPHSTKVGRPARRVRWVPSDSRSEWADIIPIRPHPPLRKRDTREGTGSTSTE